MKPREGYSEVHPTDLKVGDVIYVADNAGDFELVSEHFRILHRDDTGYIVYADYDFVNDIYTKQLDLGGLFVFRKDK